MTRSWLNFIGGMILLLVLAYGFLPSIVSTPALQQFCSAIQPGEQIEGLIERASTAGYATRVLDVADASYVLVMDKKAESHFVCEVKVHDKKAVSKRYVLNN